MFIRSVSISVSINLFRHLEVKERKREMNERKKDGCEKWMKEETMLGREKWMKEARMEERNVWKKGRKKCEHTEMNEEEKRKLERKVRRKVGSK